MAFKSDSQQKDVICHRMNQTGGCDSFKRVDQLPIEFYYFEVHFVSWGVIGGRNWIGRLFTEMFLVLHFQL